MTPKYSYNSICTSPVYSEIASRSSLDASIEFFNRRYKCCAIPANMKCTINTELAVQLSEDDYFYTLHRFLSYDLIYDFVKNNQHLKTISLSVGVQDIDKDLVDRIAYNKLRVDFITVDVAHGHHARVKEMIGYIKENLSSIVIAGNIGTVDAVHDITAWGADCVKVGIAQGRACTTFHATSIMTPMFSTVLDIAAASKIPVIADGGIRQVGDIVLALVAGAHMVMIGSEFAKCADSPAEFDETRTQKFYYGSASYHNTNSVHNVEGTGVWLQCNNMTYHEYFSKINDGIRSAMSYQNVYQPHDLISAKWHVIG